MSTERHRGRGRPRDPGADDAILKAALELFVSRGLEGASIEQIAKRAGVARVTVYRRWSSKEDLLADAIETARTVIPDLPIWQDTDAVLPDPGERLLESWVSALAQPQLRTVLAQLIGSSTSNPRLRDTYWQHHVLPRRTLIGEKLERAKRDGELPADVDPDVLMDMMVGAVLYRLLLQPEPASEPEIREYIAEVIRHANLLRDRQPGNA